MFKTKKTHSYHNPSKCRLAFLCDAICNTIVESLFSIRGLAEGGGIPGFQYFFAQDKTSVSKKKMRLLTLLLIAVGVTVAGPTREKDETILFDDGTWDGYPAPPQAARDVNDFQCTKRNGLCCAGDDNGGDGVGGPDGGTGPVLFNCLSSMCCFCF